MLKNTDSFEVGERGELESYLMVRGRFARLVLIHGPSLPRRHQRRRGRQRVTPAHLAVLRDTLRLRALAKRARRHYHLVDHP